MFRPAVTSQVVDAQIIGHDQDNIWRLGVDRSAKRAA
jgi:hypothetical protein